MVLAVRSGGLRRDTVGGLWRGAEIGRVPRRRRRPQDRTAAGARRDAHHHGHHLPGLRQCGKWRFPTTFIDQLRRVLHSGREPTDAIGCH